MILGVGMVAMGQWLDLATLVILHFYELYHYHYCVQGRKQHKLIQKTSLVPRSQMDIRV